MEHNCPYYHDEDLMPADLRQVLEQRFSRWFSAGAGPSGVEDTGHADHALVRMADALLGLTRGLQEQLGEKPELGERIAHDLVHRMGHAFAHSNEALALNALESLEERMQSMDGRQAWQQARARGLAGRHSETLAGLMSGGTVTPLRRRALDSSLKASLRADLLGYRQRVQRSAVRSTLPTIISGLLGDYRRLNDLGQKMEHFFGISSAGWDLNNSRWEQVPWDVFELSRQLLESDPSLKRLASLLGRGPGQKSGRLRRQIRIESLEEEIYEQQEYLGRIEISGVEFGDDINLLLPAEYVQLFDSDSEYRFYKELLEGELLISHYRAIEEQQRVRLIPKVSLQEVDEPLGPVVICLDTSGSMAGWPERVGKALCLALVSVCREQGRRLHLILFSTEIREMELSDPEASILDFAALMAMEFRGGTDLRPALRASVQRFRREEWKNADLLIISDFRVPKIMIKQSPDLEALRNRQGNRIHALTIGQFPVDDQYNLFDSRWHYRLTRQGQGLGITGLVSLDDA